MLATTSSSRSSPQSPTDSDFPTLEISHDFHDGAHFDTPPYEERGPVIYASSSRRGFSTAKAHQSFYDPPPKPRFVRDMSGNARRSLPQGTPYPHKRHSVLSDEESIEPSLVDEEFKRMVAELDNEEFTQLRQHEPVERSPDDGYRDDPPEDRYHANGYHDEPSRHSERNSGHFLNAPTFDNLDAEFDDLHGEGGQGYGGAQHDFSRLDGLTELELTGLAQQQFDETEHVDAHRMHGDGDDDHHAEDRSFQEESPENHNLHDHHQQISEYDVFNDPNMEEFWEHAANLATPTPITIPGRLPRRGSSTASHETAEAAAPHEDKDIDQYHEPIPIIGRESPESSLGVLSPSASEVQGDYRRSPTTQFEHAAPAAEAHQPISDSGPAFKTFASPFGAHAEDLSEASFSHHPDDHDLMSESPPRGFGFDSPYQDTTPNSRKELPPLNDILADARNECQSLRVLNERLLNSHEELEVKLQTALSEKERIERELRAEYETKMRSLKQGLVDRQVELQDEVRSTKQQLEQARIAQEQITSIRTTLEKEKELDILNIKKDLTAQKERQLLELRREMASEKEEWSRRMKEDIRRQQEGFREQLCTYEDEKDRMEKEIARLRRLLREKDDEYAELENRAYSRPRKPEMKDAEQQFDGYADQVRQYQQEVSMLKANYEVKLSNLQEQLAAEKRHSESVEQALAKRSTRADPSETHGASLTDLLARYPTQFEQYRETLSAGHSERLSAREATHAVELKDLQARHEAAVRELVSRAEEERIELIDRQKRRITEITEQLKTSCSKSYGMAMERMKQDFERDLVQRIAEEKEKWRAEVGAIHRASSRREERDCSSDDCRGRISDLEATIHSLRDALAQSALEHNQAMLESKHRNDRIQREQMRKLKDCYVSSLKTMREDLTKSEQRRLERMEIAWKEKEARLNTEWKERLEELGAKYKAEIERLRASQNASAVPPRTNGRPTSNPLNETKRSVTSGNRLDGTTTTKVAWKPPGGSTRSGSSSSSAKAKDARFTRT